MAYKRIYPLIGKNSGDAITLRWEAGYRNVIIEYQGEIIDEVANPSVIKKGYTKQIPDIGKLELFFSEKPMTLNVVIDGFHSPANQDFPAKQLGSVSVIFWILAVFSIFGTIIDGIVLDSQFSIYTILTLINFSIVSIYLVAAIFSKKGHSWAYFMGTITFSLTTALLTYLNFEQLRFIFAFQLLIRAGILFALYSRFNLAMSVKRHKDKMYNYDSSTLD